MKRQNHILFILLFLIVEFSFAHRDFWIIKDFGNVKVRIETGFKYEEINKVFIFGELSEKLAFKLGYKDQIFLDFFHYYTGYCDPDYFISFDKGETDFTSSTSYKQNPPLSKKAIVVRQVSRQFDAESTLKLLEYAVKNLSEIKSNQKKVVYNQNYCHLRILALDTVKTQKLTQLPLSEEIRNIMATKIVRPEEDFKYGVSYYWKNGSYTIFLRGYNKEDINLKKVENIYDFQRTGSGSAIIFDTDSSFYFASQYKRSKISNRNVIENTSNNYRPFSIKDIDEDKPSIYFTYYSSESGPQPKKRTLLYLIDRDKLIQNLDKLNENE